MDESEMFNLAWCIMFCQQNGFTFKYHGYMNSLSIGDCSEMHRIVGDTWEARKKKLETWNVG